MVTNFTSLARGVFGTGKRLSTNLLGRIVANKLFETNGGILQIEYTLSTQFGFVTDNC